MTKDELAAMRELDELAEKAGGLVSPLFVGNTHYNYRKIAEFCKEQKINPQDLTLEELHRFVVE